MGDEGPTSPAGRAPRLCEEGGGERCLHKVGLGEGLDQGRGGRGGGGSEGGARPTASAGYHACIPGINARTPTAGRLLSFRFRGSRIRPC